MEKVKSFISKKVISLAEGRLCGYVLDITFDENLKKIIGFKVADDENENVYFLNRHDVFSCGDECIMIDSQEVLEYEFMLQSNNPIGKNVYDTKGVFLGRVDDVEVIGKNVKKIITNKCEIPLKFIKKSGADFVIFGLTKNIKKNKNNRLIFKNKEKINKFSENLPKIYINNKIYENKNEIVEDGQIRVFANSESLIGKTMIADLFGMNNEIIARKYEIIDKKIIKNAKNHNKLKFLSYFSK